MSRYRHTQPATLLLKVFGGFIVAMLIGLAFTVGSFPQAAWILGIISSVLVLAAFLFRSLTVEVTPSEILASFGPGWIRKRFPVSEIISAKAVQNRWYYGWGIRYTPHGWLFNVSGFDAVEIGMKSGKKYRIGTDEPEELREAIASAIGQS